MNQHKLRQLDYIITMALFKWQKKTAGAYEALTSLVSMRRDDYFKAKLVLYFNRLHVKPRLRDIPNQKGSVHCVLSHASRMSVNRPDCSKSKEILSISSESNATMRCISSA